MPFGFGHHEEAAATPPPNAVSATALVTAVEEPLDKPAMVNRHSLARTQILVDAGAGPVLGYQQLPLDIDHWLTLGQSIPVFVDPAKPNEYVVDWPNVPSIEARVASKEPSIVDPMAARLKAWDALAAAGYHEPDLDAVAPQLMQSEMTAMRARLAAEPDALAHQLTGIAALTAPEGYRRALAVISTTSASWGVRVFDDDQPHRITTGNHDVVLSVSVPGSGPYPVLIRKFDHEERQYDPNNPGLPAIVSILDPNDAWVQWDEMQKNGAPILSKADSDAAVAAIQSRHSPVDVSKAPDAMKAMLSAAANATLAKMAPSARPATIAYYKAMGVEIDPSLIP